ncbi:alpha/beta hydrolase [Staphylococcus felis]|uniref:Alpha/beta hydrolase n=1 Tax=Staphylococcus felis TaxID=46127 RepID=A0A2K3ZBF9_9STAP|nr:alpha/beta hydrolase [Staphylococcus felis]AVP35736.1 alpha/beta hydrolase [Staphylococcus felis]MBH9580853.1 alpha/beta hydrolase [Staphylococcus felis]PNZ34794.1 alpha/beta hydrolase [Staphylococcus felis]QQB04280.1 alpha/beta hydrolase [Staphylococcus felis]REH75069.1 alpha/beta hydrolase [Staphylococcus felis]
MQLFRTTDGTALNYRSMGKGYPIVMLHSIYMNHTVFEKVAKRLARYFQVILIDMRGHGYSDKPLSIDFHQYAQDVYELMDFLYIDSATIIANELGGSIALDLSLRYPQKVSELILINPTAMDDLLPHERLFRKYAEKIRTWDESDQEKFLEKHLYYSNHKVRKFLKSVNDSAALLTDYEKNAVDQSFLNTNIKSFLQDISVRTLVIGGQANERVSRIESEYVAEQLPNAEYQLFKKSGVYPFVEETDRFLKAVKTFMHKTTKNMDL